MGGQGTLRYLLRSRILCWAWAGAVVAATIITSSLVPVRVSAASGTITGTVYEDFNTDGVKTGVTTYLEAEPGVAGVGVRAYDSTGALVGSATSASDGTYTVTIANAATTAIRVEFDTPAGYVASPTSPSQTPVTGANSSSRPGPIQFTIVPDTQVNYALFRPEMSNSGSDRIGAVQMWQGARSLATANDAIWMSDMSLPGPTNNIAENGEVGTLWGLAWNYTNQRLWGSAMIRRAAGLGPKGIGGLYMVDTTGSGTSNVIASFDLRDYGVVLEDVTTSGGTDYSDAERDITGSLADTTKYWDVPGYNGVGIEGIGDIDFSKDDEYLYVVNLYQRKIHRFTMGGTADAPTLTDKTDFQVPDTYCTAPNIARPWGIEVTEAGVLNVGAVCTDMVSGTTALTTRDAPEKGSILRLDPSTGDWSELTTIDFGYTRASSRSTFDQPNARTAVLRETTSNWQQWTNDWANIDVIGENPWNYYDWSQPIISDIETAPGGGFFLGISNRFNFQTTDSSYMPDPTKTTTQLNTNYFNVALSSGDTIYMCKTVTGWLQDKDPACKDNADWVGDRSLHEESSLGALAAYSPESGARNIAVTAMDPGLAYSAGFWRTTMATGAIATGSASETNDFSKSAAMGDIELLVDHAPISIGNRLWFDTNGNGIQDAGELPVVGAYVRLYNSSGTLVGTAFTNPNGEYYFSSDVSEVAAGNGNYAGGGVVAGEAYTIRVDNPVDYSTGKLVGYAMTQADKTSTASTLDDQIDSDATIVSSYPRIAVPAMSWGETNNSYDIGFAPIVSIGDRVWIDTDKDKVQDAGESGLAGVTVTLTYADGSSVYDVSGNLVSTDVTDASGNYSFTNLLAAPAGTYKVTMTTPSGYAATTPIVDSSLALTTAGASDTTLDFGVVPVVSVGDFVWRDSDADGIQDAGEPGIAGVTMTITKADGTAATDVFGNSVTTTTTDANGKYLFSNLPFGSYKVTASTPSGYVATTAGVGADRSVDSSSGNATSSNLQSAGASDLSLDFGFVPIAVSVGNFVWNDIDRDGIQDVGESGLAGVTMTITKADGTAVTDVDGNRVTSTVTDANGLYSFTNLPPGSYKVSAATPNSFVPTLAGVGSNRTVDSSTGTATSATLSLNGSSDLSLDFGFYAQAVSVGNFIWRDSDRDGIQDGGEPGISGVTVTITKADGSAVTDINGNSVTSTTTDANGAYLFSNLPPGQYIVSVATPAGMSPTVTGAGTSATDSSTGSATSTVLSSDGDSDVTLDFGFVDLPVSVGNLVWSDLDRNGVQDIGEPGLEGVVLTITKASGGAVTDIYGAAVGPVTTDVNGNYSFANLPPGAYTVTATTPSGYSQTIAGAGTNSALDSSLGSATTSSLAGGTSDLTLDFGFIVPKVSVGNFVWFDTNHDGIQDADEPGMSGVTLTITKVGGSAVVDLAGRSVTSTTTDANGHYLFDNLPPGEYVVSIATPAGMVSTVSGAGTTSTDSSTSTATSASLTTDGASDLTLDFGFWAPPATVGSRVWNDLNNDGIQDPGEPGIAGVTMTITKADGTPALDINGDVVGSVVTDADGNYVFTNLAIGTDYIVTVGAVPSYFAQSPAEAGADRAVDSSTTTSTSSMMTVSNLVDLSLDFGFHVPLVSVGDLVWLDSNGNGVRDPGEPGMANVTVTITNADGSAVTDAFGVPVSTTTTDANGNYLFPNLPPGTYKVTMTTPTGYAATTALFDTSSNLLDGESDLTLDFGVVPKVSVGNLVWSDSDRDGIQDLGEPGISGVTLSITNADGSAVTDVFGNPVTTTTTDANGNYVFDNLPLGTYKVSVVTPAGFAPTLAAQGGVAAADSSTGSATSSSLATAGASDTTLDFGFIPAAVSVGNLVWVDTDRDGVQDSGEPGIAGVTLSITKADGSAVTDVFGNAVTTTTTDVNGNYVFANLPVGSYKVTVVDPAGYLPTTSGVGTDRSIDSSTTVATSANLTVDGASDLTLDFGFVLPKVSVGNFVWKDLDGDGIQDVGEPGIANVTLSIVKADGSAVTDVYGNAVTTTTTNALGAYLFSDLPVGSYKVTVTSPTDLVATTSSAGSDSGLDSSTTTATSANLTVDGSSDLTLDFGFRDPKVSVGNFVWFDDDRDGVQDAGESGIAGVTLLLTKADGSAVTDIYGNAVTSTTTDANGNYLFDNLPYGAYTVSVIDPSGYTTTTAGAGTDGAVDSSTGSATSASLSTNDAQDLTLDFGYFRSKVSVGDLVWFDFDRDGIQDVGEPGIAGVTLSITKADGSAVTDVFGNPVTTTTTDSNGNYVFANLPIGEYQVSVVDPAGFTATIEGQGAADSDSATGSALSMNLSNNGDADTTLDFGFYLPIVSVGNLVWLDTDRDGVQDGGESGLAGVTVSITKADGSAVTDVFGNAVTSTTTDANGNYLFTNLPVGSYKVTVLTPTGYVATSASVGSDRGVDSSTGTATSSNLTVDGASDLTLDFGFVVPSVSVGNRVWFDTDRDGVQDGGESGLAGVTVSITNADGSAVTDVFGNAVTSTTTDANGNYLFANLPVGSYKVTVSTPTGYVATSASVGSDRGVDSSTGTATSSNLTVDGASDLTLDFGFVRISMPQTPPQEASTQPETTHVFSVVENATPSAGATFVLSKTVITGVGSAAWSKTVIVEGGTWIVENGEVQFTPDPGFVGTVTIKYRLTDSSGQTTESTLTVRVADQLSMPTTGAESMNELRIALSLLMAGVLLTLLARRRSRRFGLR